MTYDLVKQRYPGAPCAVGARVRETNTGRAGRIAPPRAGEDRVRVRFEGEVLTRAVDPRTLAYLTAPIVALRAGT